MPDEIGPLCTIKFKESVSPDATPRIVIDFDDRCPPEVFGACIEALTRTLGPRWAIVPEIIKGRSR